MLMLSFKFIQDPGILECDFSHLSSILRCFSGSFVSTPPFVDQITSSGGLASVSSDHNVDVRFFFSCFGFELAVVFTIPAF